jgi:hypothetical protein
MNWHLILTNNNGRILMRSHRLLLALATPILSCTGRPTTSSLATTEDGVAITIIQLFDVLYALFCLICPHNKNTHKHKKKRISHGIHPLLLWFYYLGAEFILENCRKWALGSFAQIKLIQSDGYQSIAW